MYRTQQKLNPTFVGDMVLRRFVSNVFPIIARLCFVTMTAGMAVTIGSCAQLGDAYRASSDWLNEIEAPPEPGPWRLSAWSVPKDAPYPKLSDVPPRPSDIPSSEDLGTVVERLQRDAATAERREDGSPDPVALGAPPPAQVEPLFIPGVGLVGRVSP